MGNVHKTVTQKMSTVTDGLAQKMLLTKLYGAFFDHLSPTIIKRIDFIVLIKPHIFFVKVRAVMLQRSMILYTSPPPANVPVSHANNIPATLLIVLF